MPHFTYLSLCLSIKVEVKWAESSLSTVYPGKASANVIILLV